MTGLPVLSLVLFLPLAGACALAAVDRRRVALIRWGALLIVGLDLLASVPIWSRFDPRGAPYQLTERASWIPSLGATYSLGVDGFSAMLVLLTTLTGFLAVLSSWRAIDDRVKGYYICLLVLQTGVIGVFVALDALLFFLFWEIVLVPMYFLIGIWGGGRRLYSAMKFFLYTLLGSVVMLLGILALYFYNHDATGTYSFDIREFQQLVLPARAQWWIFLAFLAGFAVKVPMVPLHTWLPDAHTDAPTAGSVVLAALLLKMGTYGFVRFSLPILPAASHAFAPAMAALSIVAIIYGALVAMAQTDWKRLIAYSSVSHMGMVTLGLFSLTPVGIAGSLLQQINHGITTGALFLLVGIVYERRQTRRIDEYGGLARVMPVFATVFLVMTMASIGLPGLNGFVGEVLILLGTFAVSRTWAVAAAAGIVLGAAYMLWLYQRTMLGPVEQPANAGLTDLSAREFLTLAPLVGLAIWIGLYPGPVLRRLEPSVVRVITRVSPEYGPALTECGAAGASAASASTGGPPIGIAILPTCDTPEGTGTTPPAAPSTPPPLALPDPSRGPS